MGAHTHTHTHTHTFVPAEFDVGEQPDLDDLPQQTQDQVLPALLQVLGSDVHHMAADGRGRVQSQVQVLLRDHRPGHGTQRPSVRLTVTQSQ